MGPIAVDGLAGASQALEGVGGVGEVVFLGGQAEFGAQLGRQEGVGVAGPGDQVIGEPEDDEVWDGVPRGLDPAGEVDGLVGEALAEALLAGEGEREAHPLGRGARDPVLVGAERPQGLLDGVRDFLGELQAEGVARLRRVDREQDQPGGELPRRQSRELGDGPQDGLQGGAEFLDLLPLEAASSIAGRGLG